MEENINNGQQTIENEIPVERTTVTPEQTVINQPVAVQNDAQSQNQTKTNVYCINCGMPLSYEQRFCPNCGSEQYNCDCVLGCRFSGRHYCRCGDSIQFKGILKRI